MVSIAMILAVKTGRVNSIVVLDGLNARKEMTD